MVEQMNKSREKMTIQELKDNIEERKQRIKELEEQDEREFTEFQMCVSSRKANIPLCRNHIIYFQQELDKRENNSLNKWL